MLFIKLAILLLIFLAFLFLSAKMVRRGISKRYEPHAPSTWQSLSEGEDPTL